MLHYWDIIGDDFLWQHNVWVTTGNLTMQENTKPDLFSTASGDGYNLAYHDREFDLVHSNSVIEHVGHGNDWLLAVICKFHISGSRLNHMWEFRSFTGFLSPYGPAC